MADNKASIILSAEDRTRAVFASVRGNLDSLQSTAAGLTVRFAAIGAAISAGLAALRLTSITDTLDQLDDLSEKSGIAVERLSELRFAGLAVGTPIDALAKGTRILAQFMADAAGGGKEAAAAFRTIGVEFQNVDKTLRSTDEVLLDIADRFAGYKEGAAESALASEFFKKQGEALIPLLNLGREGITKLTTEARALGAVYGGDLAKRAADLNDNIAKLKLASEAAAVNGLGPLIKRLADFSFEILEARKNGTLLEQMLAGLGDFLSGRSNRRILLGRDELFAPENEVQAAEENVKRVRSAIAKLQEDLARNPSNNRAAENLQRFVGDLADAEAKLQTVRTAAQRRTLPDTGAGGGRGFVAPSAPLKDAPIIRKDAASGDPDKELRRALAERAKALGDALAGEREALSFHERYLAQVYDQQLLTVEQFYDERAAAQQQALQRQLAAFDAERRALEEARPKARTPELRADIDNRLNDLLRDRGKLEQQAAQAAVLASGEVTKARQALLDQLDDYRTQLLELRGDEEAADRARAARQVQQVRALGARLSQGPEFGDQFAAASAAAIDLAQRRRELAELTEKARAAEELYVAQAIAGGAGQRQIEQGVYDLRARSLEQLRELIAKVEALAAAGDNPAAARFAEELRRQLTLANAELDPTTKRLFQAAEDIGGAFATSFERAIVEGARLSDVFKAIERDILNIVTRMLVTEPLAASIAQTIKAITTGGSSGGGIQSILTNIVGSIFGGPRAAGGPVRSGGLYQVNERGPELLKMGSRAYLMMGEQGGRVEPARAGGGAAPRPIAINVTVPLPPGASRETALQFGRRVGAEARLALSRNG